MEIFRLNISCLMTTGSSRRNHIVLKTQMRTAVIVALLAVLSVASAVSVSAPPTFLAKDWTTFDSLQVNGSRKAVIAVTFGNDDYINITRLDLQGNDYQRGFAHGALLANELVAFFGQALPQYYTANAIGVDYTALPADLQAQIAALIQQQGAAAGPQIFAMATDWIWQSEAPFTPQNLQDEMKGIADGVCSQVSPCDTQAWLTNVHRLNMMPELIKMTCTALGAWGDATPMRGLLQLRALDFGEGPFANNTVLFVHRSDPTRPDHAFASIGFPALVGVITGVAQNGIGVSEKVWETYLPSPDDLQRGSYAGEADVFVLRDILQFADTKADAERIVNGAKRTWGIWVGVGDFATQQFDLIAYRQNSSIAYNDVTMPSMTGQPFIKDVCYVDKHPQPSHDSSHTLATAIQANYGNLTSDTIKSVVQAHQTGDVHWASYDFTASVLQLAIARTNSKGGFSPEGAPDSNVWCAYNRPSVLFSMNDLWHGL